MIPLVPELTPHGYRYAVDVAADTPEAALVLDDQPVRCIVRCHAGKVLVGGQIDVRPHQIKLYLGLNDWSGTVEYESLSFGFSISDGETVLASDEWPRPNVRYISSDQSYIEPVGIGCTPDTVYILTLWSEQGGERYEATYSFQTPRPRRPYPSWSWEGAQWQPPFPPPDDGDWEWDEDGQQWVPFVE